jgi:acyl carrier protein
VPLANGVPISPTQRAIAEVWAALLGVEATQITPQDNFFELGGTSLLAMQAVSQLEQCLGRSVSARRYVFETLSQLAAGYEETPSAVQARPEVDPAPRTGMMQRLVKLVTRA